MDSYMERYVPLCSTVCVPITLFLGIHLGRNVYMHQYMCLCPSDSSYYLKLLCIVTQKHGSLSVAVYLWPNQLISISSPCLLCVHALLHVFMSSWLSMSASPPIHSYIGSTVWHCVHCSHLISVSTLSLECVHALIHVFMPMWVLNYAA